MRKIQIITETIVAPIINTDSGDNSFDTNAFPKIQQLINGCFIVKSITITAFNYKDEDNKITPQLNIVAFMEGLDDSAI